ncbi:MAG: DUF1702 family protein [Egibacteraceae bacterium]
MLNFFTAVRRAAFGAELREVMCTARGFRVTDTGARARIETIGSALLHGYDAALAGAGSQVLSLSLGVVDSELRGFAFEGVGMALTVLDQVDPRRTNRWRGFVDGLGSSHVEIAHVGAGLAFARLPRGRARLERFLPRCDEQSRWLVVDGYGFHHGFFNWPRAIDRQERPSFRSAYAARAFDQGLGRSLWFVEGADVDRVIARVRTFEPTRQADLVSGVGLAAAYAGGVDEEALGRLATNAGAELGHLQVGVALAAMARWRGGNPSPHTAAASKVICSSGDTELAQIGFQARDQALADGPPDPYPNRYERWRAQTRSAIQGLGVSH